MTGKVIRTALVNPPDVLRAGYKEDDATPPLGIAYIASVLRKHEHVADLFDLAHIDVRLTGDIAKLEAAGFFSYQLYGFTAYTKSFTAALSIASILRQRNPSAIVVFGGPHASPSAEQVLTDYADIDFVICNEGEYPMLELVRHFETGVPALNSVPNLVYRSDGLARGRVRQDRHTGTPTRSTVPAFSVKELDDLPWPARDYVIQPNRTSLRHTRRDIPVQEAFVSSSRGCPKRCTFCSIVVASPNYRVRSVESLMEEIKNLYAKSPFGHITFVDANFAVSPKRTLAFARALHKWNSSITWSGTATADLIVRHADALMEIGQLNCIQLEIGIESGSEKQLARFNKRTMLTDNVHAVRLLQRAGIALGLDFIMFDPESTLDELRENLNFLHRAELFGTSPPDCLFNFMRLYPGTPARDRYISMFNLSDHHLANIEPPFADPRVACFYKLTQIFFVTFQPAITEALLLLQDRWREYQAHADRPPTLNQRRVGLIIELQHEPYRFFSDLLSMFETGTAGMPATLEELPNAAWRHRLHSLLRRAMDSVDETVAEESCLELQS